MQPMPTITLKPNQTLADAAIMASGTMEAAMQIMLANNQSLTDLLATGTQLDYSTAGLTTDAGSLSYLQQNSTVIGTRGNL